MNDVISRSLAFRLVEFRKKNMFIGVDVGTQSVRAACFGERGNILNRVCTHPITLRNERTDFYEQSSEEIWRAVCTCVRRACAGLSPQQKELGYSIAFDATCSLVVLDHNLRPVSVVKDKDREDKDEQNDVCNVVMWLDHRAKKECDEINESDRVVLASLGGQMSVEMQTPKLMWLKRNCGTERWDSMAHFLDLSDYLMCRASGRLDVRAVATRSCKWTWRRQMEPSCAHACSSSSSTAAAGFDAAYFESIGLDDVARDSFARLGGNDAQVSGSVASRTLSEEAAADLDLPRLSTVVGVGSIDAHAGAIGTLGVAPNVRTAAAMIAGTSTCIMALDDSSAPVSGIWGPFLDALVPGVYLREAGQSASGALLERLVRSHALTAALEPAQAYALLEEHLLSAGAGKVDTVARHLHVLPDFHGNRSPRAVHGALGAIVGLPLANGLDELAALYLATVQALAHGVRHIVDTMNEPRAPKQRIDTIVVCGGAALSNLFLQQHASIVGCTVMTTQQRQHATLLGSAIMAAEAASKSSSSSLFEHMKRMTHVADIFEPDAETARFHEAKHIVFLRMYEDQFKYRSLMDRA
jgi:D-ribulokinase